VNSLDANLSNHEVIAMLEKMCVWSPFWPPVDPIRFTHRGEVEVNVMILGELLCPADKVRMDMRLCDRANAQPIFPGKFSIPVDVAFGIDNQSLLRLLTA
jgi:hypothetical protein